MPRRLRLYGAVRDISASWVYRRIMWWQVVRRSVLSLIGLCTFLATCWLVANVVPEKVGRIILLVAGLCLFPAVFLGIGWVGQVAEGTDPPPHPGRRLRTAEQCDTADAQAELALATLL